MDELQYEGKVGIIQPKWAKESTLQRSSEIRKQAEYK